MNRARVEKFSYWLTLILIVYMPLHIFLSQSLSTLTGSLEVWKAAKDVLLVLWVPFALYAAYLQGAFHNSFFKKFLYIGGAYTILYALFLLLQQNPDTKTAIIGSVYNTRLLGYFLLGYVVAGSIRGKTESSTVIKVTLATCVLVASFGVMQYFLPKDFLTHFGYSIERGVKPIFYINEDPRFTRIMSTLRDPNSLGAYLLFPLLYLGSRLGSVRHISRKHVAIMCVLLCSFYLTLSRASWAGALVSAIVFAVYSIGAHRLAMLVKKYAIFVVGLVVVLSGCLYVGRNSTYVRQDLLRINDTNKEVQQLNSDEYHVKFIKDGVKSIAKKPFGYGPGTAGIVSIQNKNGSFLTENYYIQIGHEVGVIGLMLFIWLLAIIMRALYYSRGTFCRVLFAIGVSYILMSFVMHLWSNEAVALQWWLLSGLALGAAKEGKGNRALLQ